VEVIEVNAGTEYEKVLLGSDPASGYRGIIALHSTVLGPALGGTRMWSYANDQDALTDALRLARGMTYKNALAGLPFGGGKSVIILNGRAPDREEIFRAHGRFVEMFHGRYITAEDVGTCTVDMDYVHLETEHVAGLASRSGDPSPVTARGVFRAIQAAAMRRWGSADLSGRTIALQGCGHVGYNVARELHNAGAKLFATDVNVEKLSRVVEEFGAAAIKPEDIYGVRADIFSPCGLGGIINDQTIPQLKVEIVAGAANNQLLEEKHGEELRARNILYAPDYVANAGGVINGCIELLGWSRVEALAKVEQIYDTVLNVFRIAEEDGITPNRAADRLAEQRLMRARQ
jgi:leucine dehydrogenase